MRGEENIAIMKYYIILYHILTPPPPTPHRLVDEGCIGLLTKLAGMDNNQAKHHCGTAFCNFLGDSSIHKTIIDLGALPPLVALSQDPAMSQDLGLTKALAFAIYNISCGDSAKQVMEAGVLKCLISFSEQESLAVRERVAAAICNLALSGYSANGKTIAEIMIEQNILKCITGMMDSKEEVRHGRGSINIKSYILSTPPYCYITTQF